MKLKLSSRMVDAIKNMAEHGDYELWELCYWNTWQAISGCGFPSIRTDTMKGLEKRGLVKTAYDKTRPLWKWTVKLTDAGREYSKII